MKVNSKEVIIVLLTIIRKVHQQSVIFLYPIMLDITALVIGLYLVGFIGESTFSIKLILEMGFPSVSHISNISVFANQVTILNELDVVYTYIVAIVILLIVVRAYFQGGYIRFLSHIIKGNKYSFKQFMRDGKKHCLQFVFLEIIIYFLKITIATFLLLFFPLAGSMFTLFFLITIRIIFIYLEFTIVEENVSVPAALKISRKKYFRSFYPTTLLIIFMYALTSGLSFLLHDEWSYLMIFSMIIIYSYLMTIIQAVFMHIFSKLPE